MSQGRGRLSAFIAGVVLSVCVDRQYFRAADVVSAAAPLKASNPAIPPPPPVPPPPLPSELPPAAAPSRHDGGACLARLPADPCPHIQRDDLLFLRPFVRDVDWSADSWRLTKWRLLNLEDPGPCASARTPQPAERRKVFGLGLSKTATTSLGEALRMLGYRNADMAADFWDVVVDAGVSSGQVDERPSGFFLDLDGNVTRTNFTREVRRYFRTRGKDSATDLPTALFYDELRAAFPSARFVLTTRELRSWWRSAREQFYKNSKSTELQRNRFAAYGVSRAHSHMFPKRFVEHYKQVLRSVPCCQLLVMDITAGGGWDRLCPFLDEPGPDAPFPRNEQRSRSRWDARQRSSQQTKDAPFVQSSAEGGLRSRRKRAERPFAGIAGPAPQRTSTTARRAPPARLSR